MVAFDEGADIEHVCLCVNGLDAGFLFNPQLLRWPLEIEFVCVHRDAPGSTLVEAVPEHIAESGDVVRRALSETWRAPRMPSSTSPADCAGTFSGAQHSAHSAMRAGDFTSVCFSFFGLERAFGNGEVAVRRNCSDADLVFRARLQEARRNREAELIAGGRTVMFALPNPLPASGTCS